MFLFLVYFLHFICAVLAFACQSHGWFRNIVFSKAWGMFYTVLNCCHCNFMKNFMFVNCIFAGTAEWPRVERPKKYRHCKTNWTFPLLINSSICPFANNGAKQLFTASAPIYDVSKWWNVVSYLTSDYKDNWHIKIGPLLKTFKSFWKVFDIVHILGTFKEFPQIQKKTFRKF